MRIREPKTTALIFASGKMVVTGAKSEDDSKLASRKYARIIQKLGFNAKFTDFKIQNIVGSCDIKFPIRLEGLASRHHNFSSYEPELFPGLIYRMMKPKIVLLIFVSGKIVLTGAKVREEIYQAFEMIYPVLTGECPRRFRDKSQDANFSKTSARSSSRPGRILTILQSRVVRSKFFPFVPSRPGIDASSPFVQLVLSVCISSIPRILRTALTPSVQSHPDL